MPTPKAKPYHKEDLRGDLLKAGRAYVEANGHAGLSIRTLAQQVGVSPGAPYHHFPDRRSFLLALAVEGFKELTSHADKMMRSPVSNRERLTQLGTFFIDFAQRNPRLIDLMYESELASPRVDPELQPYELAGHTALKEAIAAELPDLTDSEANLRVIAFWSAIYGFASMRRRGVIHASEIGGMDTPDVTRTIVERSVVSALAA